MNAHRRVVLVWAGLLGVSAAAGILGAPAQAAGGDPGAHDGAAAGTATRTVVSTPNTSAVFGQVVHLKAVVKPVLGTGTPAGAVGFLDGGTVIGSAPLTAVQGVAVAKLDTTTLAIGSHVVSAAFRGGGAWAPSTSLSVTVTVARDITTSTVTAVADPASPGKVNLNSKVKINPPGTGSPTGVVTYTIDGGPGQAVALGTGGRCHLTVKFTPGTRHTVHIDYGGQPTAQASSGSVTFTA